MNYREHIGVVERIEKDKMYIKFDKISGCSSCEHKSACGMSDGESVIFDFEKVDGINEGDRVRVLIAQKKLFKSVLIAYILPTLILLIFGISGNFLQKRMNLPELFTPIYSLLGLAIYFIGLKVFYRNEKADIIIEKV